MYQEDPQFIKPDDPDVKIWRYVDFSKFLSMLENRSLYFTRCDFLGDPFEGSIPSTEGQVNLTKVSRKRYADFFKKPIDSINLGSVHGLIRKSSYVCSFHMNEHESAALWSLYTKAKQGVAIQSTFSRLCESFKDYDMNPVYIGKVKYIDYRNETIDVIKDMLSPMVHKRISYEYEKEIRAVIVMPDPDSFIENAELFDIFPRGISIPVNLDILIEEIYLAPTTKPWITELLTSIVKRYGIAKIPKQSSLDSRPIL